MMTHEPAIRAWIDLPADQATIETHTLRVAGWVFDESAPLDAAVLVTADGLMTRVRLGVWRPDVGDAFNSVPHASASGFEADVDLRAIAPGPMRIALLARTGAGSWHEAASIEVTVAYETPAGRSERRARAAFTIVQNEPVMLPLWLNYYGRYFAPEDLYVLDHDSSDNSTRSLADRCRVVPIHRDASFDHRWLRSTVEAFQAFLLQSYEAVLFAEADEFVVADPLHFAGLDEYIEALDQPWARCSGFNVVHQSDEAPLRFDQPLLAQRRHWHASLKYSKRLLTKVPLRWSEGFHDEFVGAHEPPDQRLLLVHLHRVDHDFCLARHRSSLARNWSQGDIDSGLGAQHRVVADDAFEQWFRNGTDLDAPRELIPDHIRNVF